MINANNPTPISDGEFVKCLDSYWVKSSSSDVIGSQLRSRAIWEPDLTRWMVTNIGRGWTCLDIGMNNGYYTELIARLTGASGRVVSFEPRQTAVDGYLAARDINTYDDVAPVQVHTVALGSRDGSDMIKTPKTNEGASTLLDSFFYPLSPQDQVTTSEIQVRRLDSIFDEHIDFIKIDAEGSEPSVFRGFGDLSRRCPLIVTEIHPSHSLDFINLLATEYEIKHLTGEVFTPRIAPFGRVLNVVMRKR